MILKAYPKINLGLDILRRRDDGFHDIDTLMLPIESIHDTLTIEAAPESGCTFRAGGLTIDCTSERNLVVRAWMLMRERYGIGGVRMLLDKHIPFGAGLGGGSADAAAAIKGIDAIYNLGLPEQELVALAAKLGSDIPFFIHSQPMFCRGRGEIMTPANIDLSGVWCVVSKPPFGISTAEAYAGVTPHLPTLSLEKRLQLPRSEWQANIVNDFEPSLFGRHTALPNIKREMIRQGAFYASLSGSGSAMYGLFESEPHYSPIFTGEEVFISRFK